MGNNSSSMSNASTYKQIKDYHDEAYRIIEEAITLEEQERPQDAINKYKAGILVIDRCLAVSVTFPDNPDSNWENACKMIQKMKKTRGEVLTRINCIQASPNYIDNTPPPTYEEAISTDPTSPKTYTELATALNNIEIENCDTTSQIIYTHDNVKMYVISPTGEVVSRSEPETLNIVLVQTVDNAKPKAFLHIGDFVYPLVPGVSPCYRTEYGAFILPDVHRPGFCIGLILPADADDDVYELLENILHGIVNQSPIRRASRSVSTKISQGASYLSLGLIKGAMKTGEILNNGTPVLIDKISPNEQSTKLPPKLKKGIKFAQNASSGAVTVTGFVADKVGLATTRLGQYLAPHIRKQGTRLLTSGFHLNEREATSKMDDVFAVAAGAIEGFSTVYRGLETSASILGESLKNNSVKIIEHKYGSSAGESADNMMNTIGNAWVVSNNAKMFTPKSLAKQTGKALVLDNNEITSNGNDLCQPSTSQIISKDSVEKNNIDKD